MLLFSSVLHVLLAHRIGVVSVQFPYIFPCICYTVDIVWVLSCVFMFLYYLGFHSRFRHFTVIFCLLRSFFCCYCVDLLFISFVLIDLKICICFEFSTDLKSMLSIVLWHKFNISMKTSDCISLFIITNLDDDFRAHFFSSWQN